MDFFFLNELRPMVDRRWLFCRKHSSLSASSVFFGGNLKCEHTTYTVYILQKGYVHKLGRTSLFDIAFFVRCKYRATLLHPTLLRPFELL